MPIAVEVQIKDKFAESVSAEWLSSAAQTTLQVAGPDTGSLTVVITDDKAVHKLNREYLGMDVPTDVLSFGGESPDFVGAPDAEGYLGDVLIAYPQAQAQAAAANHSVESELALLVVHGVLHLLGYDHQNPEDKAAMWSRQEEILSYLGLAHIQPA
jgi:probable rRNA maturation factor